MDPYVLALQLYLFNKACGGLPLRIAEQVVVTTVVNATCWTARTIGSGVMWLVRPNSVSTKQPSTTSTNISTDNFIQHTDTAQPEFDNQFEIITLEQILELETNNQ